jgi:hypothetical protein
MVDQAIATSAGSAAIEDPRLKTVMLSTPFRHSGPNKDGHEVSISTHVGLCSTLPRVSHFIRAAAQMRHGQHGAVLGGQVSRAQHGVADVTTATEFGLGPTQHLIVLANGNCEGGQCERFHPVTTCCSLCNSAGRRPLSIAIREWRGPPAAKRATTLIFKHLSADLFAAVTMSALTCHRVALAGLYKRF